MPCGCDYTSQSKHTCRKAWCAAGGVYHIGVGFCVARSTVMGNAKASSCGTGDGIATHAFSYMTFRYIFIHVFLARGRCESQHWDMVSIRRRSFHTSTLQCLYRILALFMKPIKKEWVFFVMFSLMISVSILKFLAVSLVNLSMDSVVVDSLCRSLTIAYILTAIIYATQSKLLKFLLYLQ